MSDPKDISKEREPTMAAPADGAAADSDEPCPAPGTHAGVSRHRKFKEPACDECRRYWREYIRNRRVERGPAEDRWWNNTRSAALERLAEEYPDRFSELLAEIREGSSLSDSRSE